MSGKLQSDILATWLALAAPLSVHAQAPAADTAPGVTWQSLAPEQQKLLDQFASDWDSLTPGKQQALARGSERWLSMTPEQRDRRATFHNWRELTDEQRAPSAIAGRSSGAATEEQERIRRNFQRFRSLPAERRQELREHWRQLSPEQRQQLRERFRNRPQSRPTKPPER
jgi:hypothetical protein